MLQDKTAAIWVRFSQQCIEEQNTALDTIAGIAGIAGIIESLGWVDFTESIFDSTMHMHAVRSTN